MFLNGEKSKNGVFTLQSEFLRRETPFCAIFPGNYENSSSKFPVLYLLHGLFGRFDNWMTNTKIVEYAEECSFIIVCLEGGDGWYADSPHLKNHFYESYFLKELIPAIEKRFNADKSQKKRAIAGLSMGGYGAFKFAFRRPEMFCFAASMSGAFHAAENFGNNGWKQLQTSIQAVFKEDDLLKAENDLFQIIKNFPVEHLTKLPFFYFDCGTKDSFLPVNIRLAEAFRRRGIAHEFKFSAGGHDWDYWNIQLKNILHTAEKFLK